MYLWGSCSYLLSPRIKRGFENNAFKILPHFDQNLSFIECFILIFLSFRRYYPLFAFYSFLLILVQFTFSGNSESSIIGNGSRTQWKTIFISSWINCSFEKIIQSTVLNYNLFVKRMINTKSVLHQSQWSGSFRYVCILFFQ